MLRPASLDWITVVQDLFLEGASPARIAAWLDGKAETHAGYVVVRGMGAIDGFDATILVKHDRATSFTVWYRELERPTLATAEAVLGRAMRHPNALFDLMFVDASRPLYDKRRLVAACSADNSPEQRLVGIALNVV